MNWSIECAPGAYVAIVAPVRPTIKHHLDARDAVVFEAPLEAQDGVGAGEVETVAPSSGVRSHF